MAEFLTTAGISYKLEELIKNSKDNLSFFQELKNCKVYCFENLHTKCYLNENTAIITSMNLYDYSQRYLL